MFNSRQLQNQKHFLLAKESFLHDPGDKLNIIPWVRLVNQLDVGQVCLDDDTEGLVITPAQDLDTWIEIQYEYPHMPRVERLRMEK